MSPRQLPYNNVILWATASCLSPLVPVSTQAAILGRDQTRPETHSHCLIVIHPPSHSLLSCLCWHPFSQCFWIGKAREDMLTSLFLCLAGAFFSEEDSSSGHNTDTRISVGGQLQGLASITGQEQCLEKSDMGRIMFWL